MPHRSVPIQTMREAAVLAMSVEGAELVLRTASGGSVLVSDRDAPDGEVPRLAPQDLRAAVLRAAGVEGVDGLAGVASVEAAGTLHDLGGGLHASRADGVDQRWFATCLRPAHVARLLDGCAEELVPRSVDTRVLTDSALGASAVVVQAAGRDHARHLDDEARRLLDTCLVAELMSATADPTVRRR